MSRTWSYEGKRVVITGCFSGMGEQAARELIDLGAQVHGLDVKEPQYEGLASFIPCDLGVRGDIDAAVEEIGGPVHAVFGCAGLPTTADEVACVMVNFVGHRHLIEALVPHIPRGGAIGLISSMAGMAWTMNQQTLMPFVSNETFEAGEQWLKDNPDEAAKGYQISKEALCAYTAWRSISLVQEHGIRLNAVLPGPTDTPMMSHFVESMGQEFFDNFPKPIGRNSRPEEQAYPLIFLNSDAASYVVGVNLPADGGMMAGIMTDQVDASALMPPE